MNYNIEDIKKRYSIVGHDIRLTKALEMALMVAPSDLSVLIQGESGTGKEVLPRLIHDNSSRKTKKYLAINCGSIPEGTIDSELFGHMKGSFTDAVQDHCGYFEAADGGTLFLDEVGELPLSTQARLLRVLETGEIMRVGANQTIKTNVRVVAATNVNMPQVIRDGRFRADLYYRLCGVTISLPPLRQRGNDILKLFRHFSILAARANRASESLRLTDEAERVMLSYPWPGNIRQLRNLAEQLTVTCCDTPVVTADVLADNGISTDVTDIVGPVGGVSDDRNLENRINLLQNIVSTLVAEVRNLKDYVGLGHDDDHASRAIGHKLSLGYTPSAADATSYEDSLQSSSSSDVIITPPGSIPLGHSTSLNHPMRGPMTHFSSHTNNQEEPSYGKSNLNYDNFDAPISHTLTTTDAEVVEVEEDDLNLERLERRTIEKALRKHRNRRNKAAEELGISERTLYRKIQQYNIDE